MHGTNIRNFRYCEELGTFYLCGEEKYITAINMIRNTDNFTINSIDIQSKNGICAFEVFPAIGTIVSVDRNNEVKLFDIWKATCFQFANYSSIVKNLDQNLKMLKISKT